MLMLCLQNLILNLYGPSNRPNKETMCKLLILLLILLGISATTAAMWIVKLVLATAFILVLLVLPIYEYLTKKS